MLDESWRLNYVGAKMQERCFKFYSNLNEQRHLITSCWFYSSSSYFQSASCLNWLRYRLGTLTCIIANEYTRREHKNQLALFPHSPQFLLLLFIQNKIETPTRDTNNEGIRIERKKEVKPAELAKCSSSEFLFLRFQLLNSRSMSRERKKERMKCARQATLEECQNK